MRAVLPRFRWTGDGQRSRPPLRGSKNRFRTGLRARAVRRHELITGRRPGKSICVLTVDGALHVVAPDSVEPAPPGHQLVARSVARPPPDRSGAPPGWPRAMPFGRDRTLLATGRVARDRAPEI